MGRKAGAMPQKREWVEKLGQCPRNVKGQKSWGNAPEMKEGRKAGAMPQKCEWAEKAGAMPQK